MLYTPLTKKALAICCDAHSDQLDKSGMPYVLHPFHLAEEMGEDERAVCVALLHDVMEDTDLTESDLRQAGIPEDVTAALVLLTHDPQEPYMDYVGRIRSNSLAKKVKRADLRHNANLNRLGEADIDERAMRRAAKYADALALLEKPLESEGCPHMLGAVVGDIVGSVYEWDNIKTTEFPLFSDGSSFTDDSVMTVAVAHALLSVLGDTEHAGGMGHIALLPRDAIARKTVVSMQGFGRRYPHAGYGGKFSGWLRDLNPRPYNSGGNGSAMRVSPDGWVAGGVEQAELLACATAEVTHNHPEGIKGAQAAAACIYLARVGYDNAEIRQYVQETHGYDLGFSLDDIRGGYTFDVSCQGSVPQAIVAFLESDSFEDAIRRAVSIGGDSDTIAAITGGIAQARYGIPAAIAAETRRRLPGDFLDVIDSFCGAYL